jgi:predicted Rossmann fold flavoprotein
MSDSDQPGNRASLSDVDSFEIAVVGGGAAGLMAATFAAESGAKVVLLEGSQKTGAKILISGGGRCNVLPNEFDTSAFFTSGSTNVLRRIFRTWTLDQIRGFFENELNVPLVLERDSGKLFPESNRAKDIQQALLLASRKAKVQLKLDWRVERIHAGPPFILQDDNGRRISADKVVLATGGKSLAETGSDGSGYGFAESLGHTTLPTYPALVPLLTNDQTWMDIPGVAHYVEWTAFLKDKAVDVGDGNLLFTHVGFSGPAALNCSHWVARDGATIRLAWNGWNEETWLKKIRASSRKELGPLLSDFLPRRLSNAILHHCKLPVEQQVSQLRKMDRNLFVSALSAFELPISEPRDFRYAEVTGGGVPLSEVQPSTLESRCTPGLFLCGELLDVIGKIGGHNFLWAWCTGKLAGTQAAKK